MNPIDALKMSFQPQVNQAAKASKTKTEGTAAELGAFSQLLASASAETKETETSPTTEIQAKLEEILKALQDLPEEDLSPEQQEMLSAIVQLLSLQVKQLETTLEEQGLTQLKLEAEPANSDMSSADQQKTTVLLQQIQQKLEQLAASGNTEFDMPTEFSRVETGNASIDSEQLELAVKQLTETIQELENKEAVSGKTSASQQSEKLEQVMKQLVQLTQNLEVQTAPAETVRTPIASAEASRIAQAVAAFQPQETADLAIEPEVQAEPAPAAPAEGMKAPAAPAAPRVETPAPVVRMANLVEELSGLLRGSMRLSGTGENAQIKVSIFPEHLGHLDIRLTTVDGKVAAQIFTSSLIAKETIEMQLNQLRNMMLQQGVNLDRIEITQQSAEQSFGQQTANPEQRFNQQQKQGTPGNKNGYQRIEEEVAAATSRSQAPDGSMMKVDYTI